MFEVTITESRPCKIKKGNEWTSMGKLVDGSEPRGYTPEIEVDGTETIKRFHQIVDDLDMVGVIKAVNKI